MKRRQLFSKAVLAVSVTIDSLTLASIMDIDTKQILLRSTYILASSAITFSDEQRAIVSILCQTTISETGSPVKYRNS
jgi:hypothetical protein